MGLYLLVEKRLKGQRLGNVGLNVDEKTKRGAPRMALKALAVRPAARQSLFFLAIEKKEKKEKKL